MWKERYLAAWRWKLCRGSKLVSQRFWVLFSDMIIWHVKCLKLTVHKICDKIAEKQFKLRRCQRHHFQKALQLLLEEEVTRKPSISNFMLLPRSPSNKTIFSQLIILLSERRSRLSPRKQIPLSWSNHALLSTLIGWQLCKSNRTRKANLEIGFNFNVYFRLAFCFYFIFNVFLSLFDAVHL